MRILVLILHSIVMMPGEMRRSIRGMLRKARQECCMSGLRTASSTLAAHTISVSENVIVYAGEACCGKLLSERHRMGFGTFRKGRINEKASFLLYLGIHFLISVSACASKHNNCSNNDNNYYGGYPNLPRLFHIECQPLGAVAIERELGAILILDKAVLDLIPAAQVLAHLWVWGNRFHPHLSLGAHLRLS